MELMRLVDLLACPECKATITLDQNRNILTCLNCKREYSMKNKIPIMLTEEDQKIIQNSQKEPQQLRLKIEESKIIKFVKRFRPPPMFLHTGGKDILSSIPIGSKNILELGSGERRLREDVINLDIFALDNVDIVGEAHKLPLKSNAFDCVLTPAVLEHVKDPVTVVSEVYRILKPGGQIYAEVPFLAGYHPVPTDFQRYTLIGLDNLFARYDKIESGVCVGPASTFCQILQEFSVVFTDNLLVKKALRFIFGWFIFPLKYLDLILAKKRYAHNIAYGFYFLGRKRLDEG